MKALSTHRGRVLRLLVISGIGAVACGDAARLVAGPSATPGQGTAAPEKKAQPTAAILRPGGPRDGASGAAAAPATSADPRVEAIKKWMDGFFPWGDGTITVDNTAFQIPGYRCALVKKAYTADNRMNDQVFAAFEDDGKSAIVGEPWVDEERLKAPVPVRSEADLKTMRERLASFFRGKFSLGFNPALDRRSWKGVRAKLETGYGAYEVDGYVSDASGAVLVLGRVWDRQKSAAEQRKALIKMPETPFQGPADGTITIVEYSDMQCGFCKRRTTDWEALSAKLGGQLKIKRYLKSFPLVDIHPWAFRASSAGRCFFELGGNDLFLRWKSSVYSRQDDLNVPALDSFALDFAVANEIPEDKFRGCYLQQKATNRILADLAEGFAIRVRSTPTYIIDGVMVSWAVDEWMETYLRKTFLKGQGLPLPTATPTVAPTGGAAPAPKPLH